jgi:hypothetical protein
MKIHGHGNSQITEAAAMQKHSSDSSHRLGPAPPVVVGLGDGAGDDAEEHAGQGGQRIQLPAHGKRCGQGDEHPQAITGLVGPQAAEAGLAGGHAGSVEGSPTIIAGAG